MKFFERKYCLTQVSKDAKGELKVEKQERTRCEETDCVTLKVAYGLKMEIVSHRNCDKLPALDGSLKAELYVATENDGHGRGFHRGRYQWVSNADDVIEGRMRGITNAGTHRNCEKCDRRGHMEGVLGGKFVKGRYEGCRIRASYVFDYDPGVEGQDTAFTGALEGVSVCPCKEG